MGPDPNIFYLIYEILTTWFMIIRWPTETHAFDGAEWQQRGQ